MIGVVGRHVSQFVVERPRPNSWVEIDGGLSGRERKSIKEKATTAQLSWGIYPLKCSVQKPERANRSRGSYQQIKINDRISISRHRETASPFLLADSRAAVPVCTDNPDGKVSSSDAPQGSSAVRENVVDDIQGAYNSHDQARIGASYACMAASRQAM